MLARYQHISHQLTDTQNKQKLTYSLKTWLTSFSTVAWKGKWFRLVPILRALFGDVGPICSLLGFHYWVPPHIKRGEAKWINSSLYFSFNIMHTINSEGITKVTEEGKKFGNGRSIPVTHKMKYLHKSLHIYMDSIQHVCVKCLSSILS